MHLVADILNGLAMLTMDIYPHNRLVEVGIRGLDDGVVNMIHIFESIKSFENELKESLQVLWTGRRNENIAVSVCDSGGHSNT